MRNGCCINFNYGRLNAPVGFCSMRGEMVGGLIREDPKRTEGVFTEKMTFIERI